MNGTSDKAWMDLNCGDEIFYLFNLKIILVMSEITSESHK